MLPGLRFLTAGESHGKALTLIVDGMPSGVPITADYINYQLSRRQKGYGRGGRMKIEKDQVEILSGVRAGKTLGSPIAMTITNRDWANWQTIMDHEKPDPSLTKVVNHPRPGHTDLCGGMKYDHHDMRNILERSSARETAARVAAASVGRRLLDEFEIEIASHVVNLGGVEISAKRLPIQDIERISEESELRCIDPEAEKKMIAKIDEAKKKGDSLGGIVEVIVEGLPIGLGSHVQWDRKLDGRLAQAVMSIQAIKGVEIGMGFQSANLFGSQVHDEIFFDQNHKRYYRSHNNAGGLEGGITNGEPLVVRAVMKPLSTLYTPLKSVNVLTHEPYEAAIERTDITAVPAAAMIAENCVAFTLAEAFLEKFGGDSLKEVHRNYETYLKQVKDY
ncbi:MAG: chorismate synthase [Deltaproteobacteria bacterium]|nr:MAG: chorismate synthase [Deltaproteobacteria bacterium]